MVCTLALSYELFVMWYNKQYDTYRPTDKERVEKMRWYHKEQKEKSKTSKTESRFYNKHQKEFSKRTWIKINRQVKRWTRIFDFWCHEKWIAIEIDGWYHTEERKVDKDRKYDFYNLNKHGILVIRVDNRDDIWAIDALRKVELSESWRSRKHSLWILGYIEKKSYKDKTFMDYMDDLA
mgnify:CR=1 FL=1